MNVEASTSDVSSFVCHRLDEANILDRPFRHFYVTNVFPSYFYEMALASLPPDEVYTDRTFENRAMAHTSDCGDFWKGVTKWMLSEEICGRLISMLGLEGKLRADLRLLRDSAGYSIKPHTDVKAKVASCLFYLPETADHPHIGTSVYVPKERGFASDGTRRYEFEDFIKTYTAPFVPNTLFAFARSDNSFHGVEPTDIGPRNQMLLNLYR